MNGKQNKHTTESTHPLETGRHRSWPGWKKGHHVSNSQTKEPRRGIVNKFTNQLTTEATHRLEGWGGTLWARSKFNSAQKLLTLWRAKDRHREQGPNEANDRSHSHPEEMRTSIMSRVQNQPPQNPLTSWRVESTQHEWDHNADHNGSYSLSEEPRTHTMSRIHKEQSMKMTHCLQRRGQVSWRGSNSSPPQKPLTL